MYFFVGDKILPSTFTFNALFGIAYTAIFASVIAYLIQIGMQRFTTPTKAAIMFTVEPLSAPFFSYFIGGEILNIHQLFGAALIVTSIIVAEWGTKRKYKNTMVKIYICLIIGIISISLAAIFAKFCYEVPSTMIATYRMGISAILLCLMLPFSKSKHSSLLNKKIIFMCFLSGIFIYAFYILVYINKIN